MIAYQALVDRVVACRACPRMEGRRRVLGEGNGPLRASALLVGLAPGRHGADRTGIPFVGDRSGAVLDGLLQRCGLRREDVFVTNAVLCNPRDAEGRNAEPTAAELTSCRGHLAATLQLVEAPLVVALGRTAFRAVLATAPASLRFEDCLGMARRWTGGWLLAATYHPGPRVTNHPVRRRHLEEQWTALFGATAPGRQADSAGAGVPAVVKLQTRA
ncbi:MAG: uracil-DNA glycosylase [Chloroflexi bacterium]|nr:MAG: uracil-DNA glycosylase [Chloroflexota bacterium]